MPKITTSSLISITAFFLILFGNTSFFFKILEVYPLNMQNGFFLVSIIIIFYCLNIFILALFCYQLTIKPVLILVLLLSSLAAYFMDSYKSVIDVVMIDNMLQTNVAETLDLVNFKLLTYLFFLGILPSLLIYKLKLFHPPLKQAIIARVKLLFVTLTIALISLFIFSNFYASFFREHKLLRFYANPSYYFYSIGKYLSNSLESAPQEIKIIALDAKIIASRQQRKLVIFVVGETARADHFSLNGYLKKTNPYLEKEQLLSFSNVSSCGTSTAVSVPCMFSIYTRSEYNKKRVKNTQNLLDILQYAGVNILWLDNNSDSKGVADRVLFKDFKTPKNNPICDSECRDEGMLSNLQNYIDKHKNGDIFIVLHQMGNHGPAYYKRYPLQFEKFTPTCQSNQLETCSDEEINNAYDNAILYSDYFLAKSISLLKQNTDNFSAALLYISDHGESLGENGLYLHGLPYLIAPDNQTHVPMILWFSDNFSRQGLNINVLQNKKDNNYSHDNIFHSILGLMQVKTKVYNKEMDIFYYDNK